MKTNSLNEKSRTDDLEGRYGLNLEKMRLEAIMVSSRYDLAMIMFNVKRGRGKHRVQPCEIHGSQPCNHTKSS